MNTVPYLTISPDGTPGEGITLELPMLLETRAVIQGSSRSGKTHTLFYLLQETYGHVLHLIVDREADFVPLRGEYDYLVVGAEGDLPIDLETPGAVEALTREILRHRLSTIFDLSDVDERDRHEFVRRLCEELANLPRRSGLWTPTLLLLDEVHTFAPERGQGDAVSADAVAAVASRGAKRGISLICATQRLAALSNRVLGLCENRLIMRTADEDADRAARALGKKRAAVQQELRSLARGTGYAYGPAISTDPVLVRVPAELRVLPPKRGEMRAPPPPAPDAIRQLIEQLPKAVAEADVIDTSSLVEAERTISALRSENAQLRAELAAAIRSAARRLRDDLIGRLVAVLERERQDTSADGGPLSAANGGPGGPISAPEVRPPATAGYEAESELLEREARKLARVFHSNQAEPPPDLTAAQNRILAAVATLHSIGVDKPSRPAIGALSRYSSTSGGTFARHIAVLVDRGLLELPHAGVAKLTGLGLNVAPPAEPIRTLEQLHAKWLSLLSDAQARILAALIAAYPEALKRKDLGSRTGYTSTSGGTFARHVAKLVEMKAAEIPETGKVRASELLFPRGLQ